MKKENNKLNKSLNVKKSKFSFFKDIKLNWILYLMILPATIYFLVFMYLPMPGAYIAFVNYKISDGIFGSKFVGLDNFKFLASSGQLWRITKNTLLYNLVFIALGNFLQIAFAIMLSEINQKTFKKTTQSVILFPHFISYVIVGVFAYNFFNFENGFVNSIIKSFGGTPIDFYASPGIWKYIIVAFNIWKNTGYNMIIYLAAITGINTDIYEAAYIDGASRLQRIKHITIPMLKPTFILLLLFSLGGILKGQFDLFYNLIGNNSLLYPQTDIIDTFVFRSLMGQFNFTQSAAAGLYQSVFGFILVISINYIVKKVQPEYALF